MNLSDTVFQSIPAELRDAWWEEVSVDSSALEELCTIFPQLPKDEVKVCCCCCCNVWC